jgi:cyclopropane fatty-acyl-phospholipid synthase-like methyltransferase
MRRLDGFRLAWRFLRTSSTFWRLHQGGRSLLVPFHRLADYLPEQGVLLDLGCGHGVFLALAQQQRPALQLIGFDLSATKIAATRQAFEASDAAISRLAVMDITEFPEQSVDVISIIDVMYLVPLSRWDGILKKCYDCLKPGGRLLLKEMDRSLRWKFALLCLEEGLAVKILGWTLGGEFTFPSPEEIRSRLGAAGFKVQDVPLHRRYPAPHHLWIGIKEKA